ncbi:MAG: hypothetical protein PVH19_04195 [Planctomycetia bacterium]|jgi:hypothetical protein
MKFLPTYHTMSFHDDASKTDRDAFEEGVAYAEKNRDSIRMPGKDRIFEAGIIAALIETTEHTER